MSKSNKPMMQKLLFVLKHNTDVCVCQLIPSKYCDDNCRDCVGSAANKEQLIKEIEASL